MFAIKQMGSEEDASKVYGSLDKDEIIKVIRQESGRPESAFTSNELPLSEF